MGELPFFMGDQITTRQHFIFFLSLLVLGMDMLDIVLELVDLIMIGPHLRFVWIIFRIILGLGMCVGWDLDLCLRGLLKRLALILVVVR